MAVNVTDIREWAAKRIAPAPPARPRVAVAEAATTDAQESFGGGAGSIFADEDFGWTPADAATLAATQDVTPAGRVQTVRRARIYYAQDAICRQTARLYTSYSIGRGMSIKAREVPPDADDPEGVLAADDSATVALQKAADDFWEHPDNSYVFGFEAQHENSDKLVVDGELFFLLYPANVNEDDAADVDAPEDDVTRIRVMDDCLQVVRIITNPEDASEPWYYVRISNVNGIEKKKVYPDYRLFLRDERDDVGNLVIPPLPENNYSVSNSDVVPHVFVRHVKMNTLGQRGNSTLLTVMDWAKVNRQYLEDRATINRAHARFAWKRVVKGPASAVAAFGRKAASKITGAPGSMAVPPAPAGSTVTVNGGVDWQSMNAQDGGKNAYAESRNFRLMGFAGAGFAEHYYGDGSMGTRATSKSMERPIELLLADYQTLWKQVYQSLFAFDLKARGRAYDAHAIWVDAQQILEDDTATVVNSFVSLVGVLPGLGVDEVLIRLLNTIGIDDPQDVLPKIKQRQEELWNFSLALAQAQAGIDPTAEIDPADPQAASKQIAGLKTLLGMLTDPNNLSRMPGPKSGSQFGPPQAGQALRTRIPTPPKMKPADAA